MASFPGSFVEHTNKCEPAEFVTGKKRRRKRRSWLHRVFGILALATHAHAKRKYRLLQQGECLLKRVVVASF